MVYQKYGEYQYLNLVKDLINNGEKRSTRNAETISDFCKHLKFDLRKGFPLLTTKKMFTKGIIEELLFFIRGDTQTKILEDKGVNIWKGNTNREFLDANGFETREEGEMGPMYGSIWRNFNDFSSKKKILKDDITSQTIDQLKFVIQEIKTNPTSRRILMTSFNPGKVKEGVLWPCHSITLQFYVQDDHLDMFCYNRSSDIGLGLPFNIASSSLLLIVIAKLTNLKPRYFNLSLGDSHIYSNHVYSLSVQIERVPYTFPEIVLPEFNTLEEVEKLTYKDFKIINYNSYETVKMDMIA
jgi:thymidylate synthase